MEYPNWFRPHTKNFEYFLSQYKQIPNLNFLQIGAYTGDASEWILENILTDKTSYLKDVDTWEGSEESVHKSFDWFDLESFYDKRMSKFPNIKKQNYDWRANTLNPYSTIVKEKFPGALTDVYGIIKNNYK